ncbi:protein patched homolog 1-like isoform X2 [Symsagittifera roscoffensis]|uniref:protein patched homolog 1-like isoform X2 n=1 Tax=Symsagittifera roscoffensis TaxID=84072 RepID=UPI00307BD3B6
MSNTPTDENGWPEVDSNQTPREEQKAESPSSQTPREDQTADPPSRQNKSANENKPLNQNGHSVLNGKATEAEKSAENEDEVDDSCNACNCACLENCSNFITSKIEAFFFKVGVFNGKHPWAAILIGLAFFLLPLPGYYFWYEETDAAKLWVPQDSRAIDDRDASSVWFPALLRVSQALIVSSNVLTADIMQKALQLDQNIKAVSVSINSSLDETYSGICYKAGPYCLQASFLAAWNWDSTTVSGLSDNDVVNKANANPLLSLETNQPMSLDNLLGALDGSSPSIVGASAMTMTYYVATVDLVDSEPYVKDWESKFLDVCETSVDGLQVYRFAFRSPTDIGSGAVQDDVPFLFAGYALVILFLFTTLGKFNCKDQKVYLAMTGILCVVLSISISFSSASLFQMDYGPIHSVLPFLLLGIGVDDMFVFVSAWENLTPREKTLSLPERIGYMTKHAGVSILITSLTDFLAFLIGATTIIPALRSFCVFAAMGILGIFFLTLFLFSGVLVYDQRRVDNGRNACCCCVPLGDDYQPSRCSESSISEKIFSNYVAKGLTFLPIKIIVVLVTVGLLGAGIAGVAMIEQDFDPNWFIPEGNYLYDYLEQSETYFPGDGDDAYVFFGDIDYYDNYGTLLGLPDRLRNEVEGVADNSPDFYLTAFDSWITSYSGGVANITTRQDATTKLPNNQPNFVYLLKYYLANDGQSYASEVNFNAAQDDITSSRMYLVFSKMPNSAKRIDAMDGARDVVDSMGFGDTNAFVYSDAFLVWEGDKVIYLELFRNIGMAFIVVFLVCMLLIANIAIVVMVLSCVVFTLVDVIGLIHFWGVTINTVSTINLILAIGLAVDYAAHIGHAFMATAGSRKTRTRTALTEIGPAVFSGGFSTFLAFAPLAISTSFVFETFFKIFFLVCVLGLYHGLIYLPVMMSWLGPAPYSSAHKPGHDDSSELGGEGRGGEVGGRGADKMELSSKELRQSKTDRKKSVTWNGSPEAIKGANQGPRSRPTSPGQVVPMCQLDVLQTR